MERTVSEILVNAPFQVVFGDKKFQIRRLSIKRAQEWRRLVIEHDSGLVQKFPQEDPIERLTALSTTGPDLIVDLVLAFTAAQAGDKPTREEIEAGTDAELIAAYEQFLRVTFPNAMDAGTAILRKVLGS